VNDTNRKGRISECMVSARMLELGWEVLEPIGIERYDLLINRHIRPGTRQYDRVQVKTARYAKGRLLYNDASNAEGVGRRVRYEADMFFAVYSPDLQQTYFVPPTQATGSLRVEPTKNNQAKGILWANDFRL
jgi:hypothetical protein